ncbi:hypothetical protein FRC01_004770 [Tulasnella sp. 417]|nr:hypothetical protein FRC01_004770 [Tulasnella sp. 417]
MRPPTPDAINKALNILLGSIQDENECTFTSSCIHPLDVIPPEQLATNAEALALAKQHLDKKAEDLISRCQHRRNLAAPIHRLPQEIFGMILENFAAGRPIHDEHGLLQLLRVGRLWYHTIVSLPRLWTRVDLTLPPSIAKLVIERSKELPILALEWNPVDGYGGVEKEHEEILEMAIHNSTRFKSIKFQVSHNDPLDIRSLLESETPALDTLTVDVYAGSEAEEDGFENLKFVLSEGAPLKYLVLNNASTNFDSPRLSGLIALYLREAAIPTSLATLLKVLSATEQLELLKLEEMRPVHERVDLSPQITLGHLKELKIQAIATEYCAALLGSIFTPICSRVYVSDSWWSEATNALDSFLWQPGNTQTAALLGLNGQSDRRPLEISITVEYQMVRIRVHQREDWDSPFFSFKRPRSTEMVKLLREFFSAIPSCPPIDLAIWSAMAPSDALDLTGWSATLSLLDLSDEDCCLRALQQLAQRTAVSDSRETGASARRAEDWMCPNLQYITLRIPELDSQRDSHVAALLALVRKRWSGTDDGAAPANQPTEFDIFCTNSGYRELRGVEVEVQKVVPSFRFRQGGDDRALSTATSVSELS